MRFPADRTGPRPAAAVRSRKRLVQVQVADVGADRRRTGEPHLRVHVRAVHVDLPAVLVDDLAHLPDAILEHAMRAGIGDHQARKAVAMRGGLSPKIRDVDVAALVARHDHDIQPCHRRARRIGAVRRCRNETNIAMRLAARCMVFANRQETCEFTLRTRIRLQ